jgi:hypothetical protein
MADEIDPAALSNEELMNLYARLKKEVAPTPPAGLVDRGLAPFQGFNQAVFTGLPGLPVDTAANVIDLGKAAYGVAKRELPDFGLPPTTAADLPELTPREQVPGSSAWIADLIRKGGMGKAIDVNRPDDAISRYLHAAGMAAGSAVGGYRNAQGTIGSQLWGPAWRWLAELGPAPYKPVPPTPPPTPNLAVTGARDVGMAGTSGAASQYAAERFPDNPAMAVAAGFAPQTVGWAVPASIRGAARGGEEGRVTMNERMQTLLGAGISNPSLGLASGQRAPQALESMFSRTPLSAGVMAKNAVATQAAMGERAGLLGDLSAVERGPDIAGRGAQAAIKDYRQRQQDIEENMLNRAEQAIIPGSRFPITNQQGAYNTVTGAIPGAPTSTAGRNAEYGRLNTVFQQHLTDAAPIPGTPATPTRQVPSGILDARGNPLMITIPGTPGTPSQPGGVPFAALRAFKSRLGGVAYPAANELLTDQSTGAAKAVLGGSKQDLMQAARDNDALLRMSLGQTTPPFAEPRMARADKFYKETQRIIEDVLDPIYKQTSGEAAYGQISGTARQAGSVTRQTMASLPKDVRAKVAATVIDEMSRATPGNQDATGNKFSSQTFLTNWNKLKPEARDALFSAYPNAKEVRQGLDDIANAAAMIKEKGGVWANPSGSGGAVGQLALGAGVGKAIISGSLKTLGSVFAAPVMTWAGAKLFTNPKFVNWAAQSTTIPDSRIQQHLARLAVTSTTEKDPETRKAMQDLIEQIRPQ